MSRLTKLLVKTSKRAPQIQADYYEELTGEPLPTASRVDPEAPGVQTMLAESRARAAAAAAVKRQG